MLQKKINRLWQNLRPHMETTIMLKHSIVVALQKAGVLPDVIDHMRAFQLRPTGELVYADTVIGCANIELLPASFTREMHIHA